MHIHMTCACCISIWCLLAQRTYYEAADLYNPSWPYIWRIYIYDTRLLCIRMRPISIAHTSWGNILKYPMPGLYVTHIRMKCTCCVYVQCPVAQHAQHAQHKAKIMRQKTTYPRPALYVMHIYMWHTCYVSICCPLVQHTYYETTDIYMMYPYAHHQYKAAPCTSDLDWPIRRLRTWWYCI